MRGISKAPGTRTTSTAPSSAPDLSSVSSAPSRSLSETKELKRETMMPNFFPAACRSPSIYVAIDSSPCSISYYFFRKHADTLPIAYFLHLYLCIFRQVQKVPHLVLLAFQVGD